MRLRTTQGTSSVSVGGVEYAVGPDGIVEVPAEAAGLLCDGHGFVPVLDAPAAAETEAGPDAPTGDLPGGDPTAPGELPAASKARRRR